MAMWKGSHNPILRGRKRSPWFLIPKFKEIPTDADSLVQEIDACWSGFNCTSHIPSDVCPPLVVKLFGSKLDWRPDETWQSMCCDLLQYSIHVDSLFPHQLGICSESRHSPSLSGRCHWNKALTPIYLEDESPLRKWLGRKPPFYKP